MFVSAAILPLLLSLDIKLSPVSLLVNGELADSELSLRKATGEYLCKLSLERERGAGLIKPKTNIIVKNIPDNYEI